MKTFNINRRHFLKGASASLALSSFGAYGLDLVNPAKPLRVGLIGAGWYGKSDLFRLMQVAPVDVVALCDPDRNMLTEAGKLVAARQISRKTPRLYGDYQKLLAENALDIVLIGSPDHWHALQMIDAVKAGAHVYVQKPISVDVLEGEAMVAAARKYGKTVQVGTQRKSTPHLIQAKKEIIDKGLLGKVRNFNQFYQTEEWIEENYPIQDASDMHNADRLVHFKGTHPKVMQERIAAANWKFEKDLTKETPKMNFRRRVLQKIEDLTGLRLFEYRNYKIVK